MQAAVAQPAPVVSAGSSPDVPTTVPTTEEQAAGAAQPAAAETVPAATTTAAAAPAPLPVSPVLMPLEPAGPEKPNMLLSCISGLVAACFGQKPDQQLAAPGSSAPHAIRPPPETPITRATHAMDAAMAAATKAATTFKEEFRKVRSQNKQSGTPGLALVTPPVPAVPTESTASTAAAGTAPPSTAPVAAAGVTAAGHDVTTTTPSVQGQHGVVGAAGELPEGAVPTAPGLSTSQPPAADVTTNPAAATGASTSPLETGAMASPPLAAGTVLDPAQPGVLAQAGTSAVPGSAVPTQAQ